MTDLSTKTPAELEALLSEVQAALKARADLLAIAVGDAFDRLPDCWNRETFTASVCGTLRAHGMELASAPAEPVDDAWIERTARETVADWYAQDGYDEIAKRYRRGDYDNAEDQDLKIARATIRATLSRVPVAAWPGEDELRAWERELAFSVDSVEEAVRMTVERLRAYQTGGEPKPEPEWIDWHGGECPVPAGTRVEYKLRRVGGVYGPCDAALLRWDHFDLNSTKSRNDIIAYRILGEPS